MSANLGETLLKYYKNKLFAEIEEAVYKNKYYLLLERFQVKTIIYPIILYLTLIK